MRIRSTTRQIFLAAILAMLPWWAFPVPAFAHPLGNFTINHYIRIEPSPSKLHLVYIIDMAEIPAHTERSRIDTDGDAVLSSAELDAYVGEAAQRLADGLEVNVNGRRHPLTPQESRVTFPAGQAGLPTLRLVVDLVSPLPEQGKVTINLHNHNYTDRLGWREMVVRPAAGTKLLGANIPQQDTSQELTAYPQEMLALPLDIREASLTIALTALPAAPQRRTARDLASVLIPARAATGRAVDPFADLIAAPDLQPWAIVLAMAAALGWGALHALSPGHGKTIVAAYLVGSRATMRHAALLGITTTLTHTAGVFLLGFVILALSRFVLTEQFYPWLNTVSGLLVAVIGLTLIRERLREHGTHSHAHPHGHDNTHAHGANHPHHHHDHGGHSHAQALPGVGDQAVSWRSLVMLGISGGLLPCPSALVLMLGAVSLNRIGFGLLLIGMFSLGLAGVLTAIGIAMVHASRWVRRLPESGRVLTFAPIASAGFITVAGLAIMAQALAQTGVFVP